MDLPRSRTRMCGRTGGHLRPTGRVFALALVSCLVLTCTPFMIPIEYASAQAPVPNADDASALLSLINAEREKESLPALEIDEELSGIAASHAADMIGAGFFGHVSPTKGTLATRFHNAGVFPSKFAENLAGNTSLEAAHKMLMESPAHKGNILGSDFAEVGIAVIHGGPYGLMIVEEFAKPPVQSQ